jgi:DNA-binding response OmpR family regulator
MKNASSLFTTPATIMVIDDEPENLNVLEASLTHAGYRVSVFPRGDWALAAAQDNPPDLVLLDIRMPNMNGYEVCRRFKSDDRLSFIPIIFISALSASEDITLGFEMSGADYIVKPFREPEVLARIRTHLDLRQHQFHLERLVLQRTFQLDEANRRLRVLDEAKTHWIHMLGHELRTPLTGVFCIAESMFLELPPSPSVTELHDHYNWACGRIQKILADATTLATIGASQELFARQPTSVAEALSHALIQVRSKVTDVAFTSAPDTTPTALTLASPDLLRRALEDLIATAACCTPSGAHVCVHVSQTGSLIAIDIATLGKRLPPEELATFFDIGEQRTLHKGGADFGLGPALAFRILQLFDGTAAVRNGETEGIVIEVRLPCLQA